MLFLQIMSDSEYTSSEILFEYMGSRIVIEYDSVVSLCKNIEGELRKFGVLGSVSLSSSESQSLIVQRYSEKWCTFIDVSRISQIIKGDKVTVVPKPTAKVSW